MPDSHRPRGCTCFRSDWILAERAWSFSQTDLCWPSWMPSLHPDQSKYVLAVDLCNPQTHTVSNRNSFFVSSPNSSVKDLIIWSIIHSDTQCWMIAGFILVLLINSPNWFDQIEIRTRLDPSSNFSWTHPKVSLKNTLLALWQIQYDDIQYPYICIWDL